MQILHTGRHQVIVLKQNYGVRQPTRVSSHSGTEYKFALTVMQSQLVAFADIQFQGCEIALELPAIGARLAPGVGHPTRTTIHSFAPCPAQHIRDLLRAIDYRLNDIAACNCQRIWIRSLIGETGAT
ncbi:hypothetical protein AX284_07190 [Pseudomonas sp. HUK17]|nr:hypothetical protein AX284_07190 [Pseudomonas sp. HUK17]